MGQAPEGPLRVLPRQSCYPLKSRRDRIGGRWFRGLSLQQFRVPGAPLPSTGSLGSVPPLHRYYQGAPTPHLPSRLASLPSLGGTSADARHSLSRLPAPAAVSLDLRSPAARPAPATASRRGVATS